MKCSTSLAIKEMQSKWIGEDAGEGGRSPYIHCWWEGKLVQPLWKSEWRFLKKLKTDLPYDLVIPFWGSYLKEYQHAVEMFISPSI
jgi:hypothetical protein